MISIGTVIIGQNQDWNLSRLVDELKGLPFVEVIYVDSQSRDSSVATAKAAGWRVVTLLPDGVMSAAAARHAGTLECTADWILYLDGDMRPNLETLRGMAQYLAGCTNPAVVGMAGDIVDVTGAGAQRVRTQKSRHLASAIWFGGAVILRRDAVLSAGNWNPSVHAEEELDLAAKLRLRRGQVLYWQAPLVYHFTSLTPAWKLVCRLLGLYDASNPRNGGLGQAIRSAIESGSLRELALLRPELLIVPLGSILLVSVGLLALPLLAAAGMAALFLWICVRRGPQYIPVCYLSVVQIAIGVLRYHRKPLCFRVEQDRQ